MSPTEPVVCKKYLRRLQGNGYIRAILLEIGKPNVIFILITLLQYKGGVESKNYDTRESRRLYIICSPLHLRRYLGRAGGTTEEQSTASAV